MSASLRTVDSNSNMRTREQQRMFFRETQADGTDDSFAANNASSPTTDDSTPQTTGQTITIDTRMDAQARFTSERATPYRIYLTEAAYPSPSPGAPASPGNDDATSDLPEPSPSPQVPPTPPSPPSSFRLAPPGPVGSGDVSIVTYNTASGNSRYNDMEKSFPGVYEDLLQGDNPSVLALQEVGEDQWDALKDMDNVTVIGHERNNPFVEQHIALVVPNDKYEVLSSERGRFDHGPFSWGQGDRQWVSAKLRDKTTGQVFTVFNTHLSTEGDDRISEAQELARLINEAKKDGPVLLAGDLNTRPPDDPKYTDADRQVREILANAGLTDLGEGARGGKGRSDFDYVMSTQGQATSTKIYSGDQASQVSDHDAEGYVVHF